MAAAMSHDLTLTYGDLVDADISQKIMQLREEEAFINELIAELTRRSDHLERRLHNSSEVVLPVSRWMIANLRMNVAKHFNDAMGAIKRANQDLLNLDLVTKTIFKRILPSPHGDGIIGAELEKEKTRLRGYLRFKRYRISGIPYHLKEVRALYREIQERLDEELDIIEKYTRRSSSLTRSS